MYLTAIVFIRIVDAVLHMVTFVFGGNALALLAGELIRAAGSTPCLITNTEESNWNPSLEKKK